MRVLPRLFKLWPWIDLDLFYIKVKHGYIGFCMGESDFFYAPEGTSGGILKSNCPSVRPSVRPLQIVSQQYLINYWSKFDETSQKDKG